MSLNVSRVITVPSKWERSPPLPGLGEEPGGRRGVRRAMMLSFASQLVVWSLERLGEEQEAV